MSEKKFKKLRQSLGYKVSHHGRKYQEYPIKQYFKSFSGKRKSRIVTLRRNVGARDVYRREKRLMKAGKS